MTVAPRRVLVHARADLDGQREAARLRVEGFELHETNGGAAALALAKAALPDVMVVDAELRDMAAMVVCERVRREPLTESIPIILTSKSPLGREERAAAIEAGADACLTADADGLEVTALVRAIVRARGSESKEAKHTQDLRENDRRKNELFAVLAHELRNPLAAVNVGLSLLRGGGALGERDAKVLANLERQTHHLTRLVDDLLDVSHMAYGKVRMTRTRLDLGEVLRSAVEAARPSFDRKGVRLELVAASAPLAIEGDGTRLEQVVANLLDNAMKYTPAGGLVTVEVEPCERGLARFASIRVRDTGSGISRENLDELFQIFVQGDTSGSTRQTGLGLGLTIVRRLVELHGGHVSVRSDGAGQGAEFAVEIPLAEAAPADASPVQASSPPSGHLRVLLVDDNEDSCSLYELALSTQGHTVDTAFTGTEGLERLVGGNYDVAIIDIGLPGLDGYEVARRARAALAERTPLLVAMTGYGRDVDRASSRDAGFGVHLVKPVDVHELVTAVDNELSAK